MTVSFERLRPVRAGHLVAIGQRRLNGLATPIRRPIKTTPVASQSRTTAATAALGSAGNAVVPKTKTEGGGHLGRTGQRRPTIGGRSGWEHR